VLDDRGIILPVVLEGPLLLQQHVAAAVEGVYKHTDVAGVARNLALTTPHLQRDEMAFGASRFGVLRSLPLGITHGFTFSICTRGGRGGAGRHRGVVPSGSRRSRSVSAHTLHRAAGDNIVKIA
jgi:hypothetical protein